MTVRPSALRRDWVRACLLGELVGFVPPAVAGASLVALDASEPALVAALVVAGSLEGLVLGTAQARALARHAPSVTGWVVATAAGAGIAWFAGMAGSSIVQAVGPFALLVVVPLWTVGLFSLGALQARRLDHAGIERTNRWTVTNAGAWAVGVMIPVVGLGLVPNSAHLAWHVVAGVAGAVTMGLVIGVVTGRVLERLVGSPQV